MKRIIKNAMRYVNNFTDKIAHTGIGSIIINIWCVFNMCILSVFDTRPIVNLAICIISGMLVVSVVAIVKEVTDRDKPNGRYDIYDILATVLGGLISCVTLYITIILCQIK